MTTAPLSNPRGVALVKILVFTTVLLALTAFGARTTRTEIRISHNDTLEKRALALAEAGIHHAFRQIQADVNAGAGLDAEVASSPTTGFWTSVGGTSTSYTNVAGLAYRQVSLGGGQYHVGLDDNFDETIGTDDPHDDQDDKVRITSHGVVGESRRTVEATVRRVPLFGNGLFGRLGVTLSGGATTDSYRSDDPTYSSQAVDCAADVRCEGNIGTNGDVTMGGSPTTVNGDAVAGGAVDEGSGTVNGEATEGAPQRALSPVAPCNVPGNVPGAYSTGTGITGGTYQTSGGQAYQLKGTGNTAITLANASDPTVTTIYCLKSVSLTGSSTLQIPATGGPVRIYLTDVSNFTGGGIVNLSGKPANLQIYSSYPSTDDNQGITVNGGANVFLTIYAPDTAVKFAGGGQISGSAVGRTIKDTGGAQFHYDETLGTCSAALPACFATEVADWHDVRF